MCAYYHAVMLKIVLLLISGNLHVFYTFITSSEHISLLITGNALYVLRITGIGHDIHTRVHARTHTHTHKDHRLTARIVGVEVSVVIVVGDGACVGRALRP